jgi:hypothetical protein
MNSLSEHVICPFLPKAVPKSLTMSTLAAGENGEALGGRERGESEREIHNNNSNKTSLLACLAVPCVWKDMISWEKAREVPQLYSGVF